VIGYSLKPRGSRRWVNAAIVVPLPDASQPSKIMSVGTALSQHAFSRSYRRNCKPGTMRLYSSRDSLFFKLMFSSMVAGQFYSGRNAFAPDSTECIPSIDSSYRLRSRPGLSR